MMKDALAKNKRKKKSFFLELEVNQDEIIYANIKKIDRKMTFISMKARSRRRATESTERSKFRIKKTEI